MEMHFTLEGLDCPVCAAKIEKKVRQLQGIRDATVNMPAQRLWIDASMPDAGELLQKIRELVAAIEPDVRVEALPNTEMAHSHGDNAAQKSSQEDKEAEAPAKKVLTWLARGLGLALFIAGLVIHGSYLVEALIFVASYLLIGGGILLRALRNIHRGQIFDENFLMAVATIGAFAIGEHPEAVAVMIFYRIGEALQELAVRRSRRSIAALMDIRPDYANLKTAEGIKTVSPEAVRPGDTIVVKPGERVPLDGVVVEGFSALDTAALTGESMLREVAVGAEALSGSINTSGLLEIRVTKEYGESTVSKILDLVENAGSKKAPVENFITSFARYYTPAVVGVAAVLAIVPPLLIPGAAFATWLYRALVFLVVSCPCALVISIPLTFFAGIGGASRQGILIKGSAYLEALNKAGIIVFDKTGTLTKGAFAVTEVAPQVGWTREQLLEYAAHGEAHSNHPIAQSIRAAYSQPINARALSSLEEIPGQGIRFELHGPRCAVLSPETHTGHTQVLAGNRRLLEAAGIFIPPIEKPGTGVLMAINRAYAGYLTISDEAKKDSKEAIRDLKRLGIPRIVMFTGDTSATAEAIGAELGLDRVYAELLPHQKVAQLEELERDIALRNKKLIFVGDGINDAPVLARSDIGVAMGGLGSDAAIEAADIVLMTDEPSKLATALRIARKTHSIVVQNIAFALGIKGVLLFLGALGIASMWAAVFGDVGVALLAALNALRAMRPVAKTQS